MYSEAQYPLLELRELRKFLTRTQFKQKTVDRRGTLIPTMVLKYCRPWCLGLEMYDTLSLSVWEPDYIWGGTTVIPNTTTPLCQGTVCTAALGNSLLAKALSCAVSVE